VSYLVFVVFERKNENSYIYIYIYSLINSFIHSSMALQSFVGPWPRLKFSNLLYTVGRTPLTGVQPVARPLPTHRTIKTQN
jgi:hypothetical protein